MGGWSGACGAGVPAAPSAFSCAFVALVSVSVSVLVPQTSAIGEHAAAPSRECVPSGQVEHAPLPAAAAVPAGHLEHFMPPFGEYCRSSRFNSTSHS